MKSRYMTPSVNSQHASNKHVNKQLVNSENWSLNYSVAKIFYYLFYILHTMQCIFQNSIHYFEKHYLKLHRVYSSLHNMGSHLRQSL